MSMPRFACLALLLASSTAHAQVMVGGYAEPPPPSGPSVDAQHRIDARAGMLLGGSDVGDADGFSMGITTGLGYRVGDLTLRARFDHYRVGDGSSESMVRRGRGTRLGGALRWSFANSGIDRDRNSGGVGADFWGELGGGVEHVAWKHGGVLDRPSAEIAIGFEMDGYGRPNRAGRRRHIGYFMAFRSFIARGPELPGPATCAGPCDMATKPSRTDVSMFFELGLHWGR